MQCPTDGTTLVMSERSGIEIDYCPQCRGVWLDRGELDKIIERAGSPSPERPREEGGYQPGPSGQGHDKKKRRESWLSELFD